MEWKLGDNLIKCKWNHWCIYFSRGEETEIDISYFTYVQAMSTRMAIMSNHLICLGLGSFSIQKKYNVLKFIKYRTWNMPLNG